MEKRGKPHILSATHRKYWRSTEASIWSWNSGDGHRDPALSVLRTLFDQPRWLEAHLLYDERGSRLFDEICELPEYYLTRTENSILAQNADQMTAAAPVECIVELGAGFSKKTVHLLREQVRQRKGGTFAPLDVSLTALIGSRTQVREQFPEIAFHGLLARYEEGVASIERNLPTLFVFLGSSVGNLTRSEFVRFFQHLSESMGPKDFLLLGVDRLKEVKILEEAYNDSQGVTEEFIRNVFKNINRLLGGNFDQRKMRYYSRYNPEWQQIEMYTISTVAQEIRFPTLGTSLWWEKDDRILVEISRKFEPDRLQQQLQAFALKPVAHFTDPKEWFSVLLLQKSEG